MAICPYCQKEICLEYTRGNAKLEVHREVKGVIKKEIMYSCPHCRTILGFGSYVGGLFTGRP